MKFHGLWLGQLSMDEFVTKFTSLLRYVSYILEEKSKVDWFMSILLVFMKDCLELHNPKTMYEATRKAQICYQWMKEKGESDKVWLNKKG